VPKKFSFVVVNNGDVRRPAERKKLRFRRGRHKTLDLSFLKNGTNLMDYLLHCKLLGNNVDGLFAAL
jgi:hypothetical protein